MTADTFTAPAWLLDLQRAEEAERAAAEAALLARPDPDALRLHLSRFYGSHQRPAAFLDLADRMRLDGAAWWRLVMAEWSSLDAIPHAAFAAAFRRRRAAWTPDAMAPADRAMFDALPPLVTIYRGQSDARPLGVAWTLRRDVAAGFAAGHRGIRVPLPVVVAARVRRCAVAFCSAERREAEAVLFRPPARSRCAVEPIAAEAAP